MKLKYTVLLPVLVSALHAQLTTISQLVLNGDGTRFTGEVVIAVPPFSSRSAAVRSRDVWLCSSLNVITGCAQQIVNGVLTVALLPNGGGSPNGTSYFVSYYPDVPPGRRPSVKTEYWAVPAGGPYTIDDVKTSTPPVPTIQISPTQLNPAGYLTGQYPCVQTGAFAPCGPTAGAVWGQITGTLSSQADLAAALAGKAPFENGVAPVTVDPAVDFVTACPAGSLPQLNTITSVLWVCAGSPFIGYFWGHLNIQPVLGSQAFTSSYPVAAGRYIATSDGSELQGIPACAVWRAPTIPGAPPLSFRAILGGGQFDLDCLLFKNGAAQLVNQTIAAGTGANIFASQLQWKTGLLVSDLGACDSSNERTTRYVTDANAPTFLGTLTGGGSTKTPVVCNGTAWIAF